MSLVSLSSFHHVNAFEDAADNVYLDFSTYVDDTIALQLSLASLFNRSVPPLTTPDLCRYELANVQAEAERLEKHNTTTASGAVDKLRGLMRRVSMNQGSRHQGQNSTAENTSYMTPVATRTRTMPGLEMPRINPIYHGLDYKYTWGVGLLDTGRGDMYDCIMKHNVKGEAEPIIWSQVGDRL